MNYEAARVHPVIFPGDARHPDFQKQYRFIWRKCVLHCQKIREKNRVRKNYEKSERRIRKRWEVSWEKSGKKKTGARCKKFKTTQKGVGKHYRPWCSKLYLASFNVMWCFHCRFKDCYILVCKALGVKLRFATSVNRLSSMRHPGHSPLFIFNSCKWGRLFWDQATIHVATYAAILCCWPGVTEKPWIH